MISRHLTLDQRKTLCVREAIHSAFSEDIRVLCVENNSEHHFVELLRACLNRADEASLRPTRSPDEDTLEEFVRGLADNLEPSFRVLPPEAQNLLRKSFEATRETLKLFSCEQCGRASDRVCRGYASDDELIDGAAGEGRCIKRFREHFENIREIVTDSYRDYSSDFGALDLPKIEFATQLHARPTDVLVAQSIGGKTTYHDTKHGLVSRVSLDFDLEQFDFSSSRSAAYILTHELTCHAFSGIRPGAGNRPVTRVTDKFAEGWMDYVAELLFSELDIDFAELRHGQRRHESRRAIGDRRHQPGWTPGWKAAVYRGYFAADRVWRLIHHIVGDDEVAEKFLGLSYDLNLERGLQREQELFVDMAYRSVPEPEVVPVVADGPFGRAIRKYLQDNDLRKLLRFRPE